MSVAKGGTITIGEIGGAKSHDDTVEIVRASAAMMNNISGGKLNPPAPEVPKWFTKELTKLGGKTPDGEPKIRLVWGCDAISWQRGRYRLTYLDPLAIKPVPIGWEISQLEDISLI